MGVFSWITQDTGRSIVSSNNTADKPTFKVHMIDGKGRCWEEENYSGYGEFGGKDFYELIAEMNGCSSALTSTAYTEYMRNQGIAIAFGNEEYSSPNLVEEISAWYYVKEAPRSCEHQGYFY